MPAIDGARELLPRPEVGRAFSTARKVRLGDVTPKGRLRLDAAARYLQDVANDDARDAQLPDAMWWILRRTKMVVHDPIAFDEVVELTTWCSGYGGRWAERRTSLVGDRGGRIEAVAVWVSVDQHTGAPRRVDDSFVEVYGPSAQGRKISPRLQHGEPGSGDMGEPWIVRFTDLDIMGHVNNAVYWSVVEQSMAAARSGGGVTASVEFRSGIDAHRSVVVPTEDIDGGRAGWFVLSDSAYREVAASYRWRRHLDRPPVM